MDDAFIRRSRRLRLRAIIILNSSLPGLTPQVGFTRLAAHNTEQLGQARVAVQSIHLRKTCLTKKMDARVKPAHDWQRYARTPMLDLLQGIRVVSFNHFL